MIIIEENNDNDVGSVCSQQSQEVDREIEKSLF